MQNQQNTPVMYFLLIYGLIESKRTMIKKYLQSYSVKLPGVMAGLMLLFAPLQGRGRQVSIKPVPLPGINLNIGASITSMCQDKNGFIWLATNGNGIYKYDGRSLIRFTAEGNNPNSLVSNYIECVYAGMNGYIWIGSYGNELERLDPETGTFTRFQHQNNNSSTVRSNSIRTIIESHDGILWIGTASGLDKYNPTTGKFTHVSNRSQAGADLNRSQVRVLYEDKNGVIWIGCGSPFPSDYANPETKPGGLYKLDRNTGKITQYLHKKGDKTSLIDNRVTALFEDSRGTFWVGTAGDGLHIMDREKGTFQRLRYDPENPQKLSRPPLNKNAINAVDHIRFITEDSGGYIWIGTFAGGINRYNPISKKVEFFGTSATGSHKLEMNDFWACMKTKDNLLWFSPWIPGKMDTKLYKVSTISGRLNFSRVGTNVNDFAENANGNMWFATDQGLLLRKNNNRYESFLINKNKNGRNNIILGLESDPNNNLWVSTEDGLYYFNTNSHVFTRYRHSPENSNSISSDTVFSTQLNGNGSLWVATYYGLNLLDIKTGRFIHFLIPNPSNQRDNIIESVKIDSSGNIWVGSVDGLYRMERNDGKFIVMKQRIYLDVGSIYEDSRHRIWAATSDGLLVKYPGTNEFTQFRDSTSLMDNSLGVYGIAEDKRHSLWITSTQGLFRLNPDTKNAVLFDKSWDINLNAGGINREKVFTSSRGEIFLADTAGYYHFFPKDFEQPAGNLTHVYLGKFYLDNSEVIPGSGHILKKPLSQTQKITLNYHQNNFAVGFNDIDYLTAPSEQNVLYKLENFDNVWRKNRDDNQAIYYNIPPGEYVFRIKSSNLYGNWQEKSLAIVITPPWWKTWWAYGFYGLLFIAGIFSVDRIQRKRLLEKEHRLAREKELVQAREIEKAYTVLKATQAQLIQAEKMASLGELTAGIAHEIKNPLNFVNNFSEISVELLDEIKEELEKNDKEEVLTILDDLKQNLAKINHHGKRADSIVKGMLLHSRGTSGEKTLTDVNDLLDQYVNLAYHGMKAHDKDFDITIEKDYDKSIRKINVVPQDISRVFLNIINNACYAAYDRKKKNKNNYSPALMVSTKNLNGNVEIRIGDNGNGIPKDIVDKIFQPFFTTKPTGEGTGLGLSLSYDIVTKVHGGELKVETKEGNGTTFIIQIPG